MLIGRKQRGKLVSFDLESEFDRVRRTFLHTTMTSLGFNSRLVQLLARIGELSSSRLLVNGHLSAPIPIQRSVRQGDPLSMHLFVLYLHPLMKQLEQVCGNDLVVGYADDITVIVTSPAKLERIRELFFQFEQTAGAKLNWGKTKAIDVGLIDGNPMRIPWVSTEYKLKILGVFFANSIRLMIKLNWDSLVTKFSQHVWLHSLRRLPLHQKVTVLNTFISSKMWYISSILPPYAVHTSKITAKMGSFLWSGIPARVPMHQLARNVEQGGLKLHIPLLKCKALLINRCIREIDSMAYYKSFIFPDNPTPANPLPDYPCLKLIILNYPNLPPQIRDNPSTDLIHRFYLDQTDLPKVVQNIPNINWTRVWRNIASKRLPASTRSELYLMVNQKQEHRQLMHRIGRADGENCVHCGAVPETLQHKYSRCPRVVTAWNAFQRKLMAILNNWRRISFEDLLRPTLYGVGLNIRTKVLKLFVCYICYINIHVRIDVNELVFALNCEV